MANDTKPNTEHADDDHTHEIAGFRVGERNIPASAIAVFLFVIFIALISWIPGQGF
jgi:hypothetical protein